MVPKKRPKIVLLWFFRVFTWVIFSDLQNCPGKHLDINLVFNDIKQNYAEVPLLANSGQLQAN